MVQTFPCKKVKSKVNPNKAMYTISKTFKDCEQNTIDGLKSIDDDL